MKAILEVETLQICTTNACVLECANCTHLVGHHKKPYMMSMEEFRRVVDSLEGYPKMIGLIGGEVLLVPWFAEQAKYLRSKFPREQLGLWSTFPEGEKYSRHANVICETFGNILLNDHAKPDIMHSPMLVAAGEFFKTEADLELAAWNCWVQNHWSPGITPKGAFFCEVAAELDQLFDGPGGWDVSEKQWWKKTPVDYREQIKFACSKCGGCLPLQGRSSQDNRCDISEGNAEALKGKSRKVDNKQVIVHKAGEFVFDQARYTNMYPDQSAYKEAQYRQRIAAKYGILLVMNKRGYWEPTIMPDDYTAPEPPTEGLHQIYKSRYSTEVAK